MKRLFTSLIASIFLALAVLGQSLSQSSGFAMTDQKLLEYITQASEEGRSQQEIMRQLMQWGVTAEQMRRIKTKYQNGDQQLGAQNNVASSDQASNAALRQSNGELTQLDDEAIATLEGVLNIEQEEDSTVINRQDMIFGHDIFNNQKLTFEPNMNISAPQDYIIGPGDEIIIDIFGATQVSIHRVVNAEGVIVVDQYGPLAIGGFRLAEADRLIRTEVGAMYESSTVRVSVGQTRVMMVNIMGEVNVPGTYRLSAFSTVFHALYAADGINDIGTLRNIKVYRGGREISTVDVYDYILNGKLTGDVKLQDNDVIIVGPYQNIVKAEGCIKRAMKYEMKPGETLAQLMRYVGGFAANAYTDAVRVMRSNGKRSTAYNVNISEAGAFVLENGDVITADQHQDRFENIVEVRGAAFRPGIFHIGGNVNTVRQLIEAADGLTETAIGHHALMYRMNPDRTHALISVDINGILNGTVNDLPLKSEDILYIPSNEEALKKRTIEIMGEVFNPGIFEYADNETIEDLILQAGGLLETASDIRIDVARRVHSDNERPDIDMPLAEFLSFRISKDFIIDHDANFHLEPYDLVYVRRDPAYFEQQNVEVSGQVLYPGPYTLTRQSERLSDLIQKAGGLNAFAYSRGASLQRRLTTDEQYQLELQLTDARSNRDTLEIERLQQRMNSTYNVGIDLEMALRNPGSEADLVLRSGDILLIPKYDNTVKVSGEVFYPNTITYTMGKGARFYINQAGGYANDAARRNGYIIYKNGKVALIRKGAKVEPGCEIVVPVKEKHDYTAKLSTYIAIASSLATVTALILNIIK